MVASRYRVGYLWRLSRYELTCSLLSLSAQTIEPNVFGYLTVNQTIWFDSS